MARYLTDLKTDELEIRDLFKLAGLVGLPMAAGAEAAGLGTSLTYLPILVAACFWRDCAGSIWPPLRWWRCWSSADRLSFLQGLSEGSAGQFHGSGAGSEGHGLSGDPVEIAVGNGGMWGKGVTKGTQTQLRFLPVPHTDFIFSAFAEEHGFVGVVVVLGLYFVLIMHIVQNAQTAPDRAGMYICMGVAALLLFHVLVNVGMVVGRCR